MGASKLSIYNGAACAIGDRQILSLTETRRTRRDLDDIWSRGGVSTCLQMGQWNFATRTVKYDYSPSVEPPFGLKRAFNKPDDWVRTLGMCQDEFFHIPLLDYVDEAGYWYSNLDTIYVRFVSKGDNFGMNLGIWPENFTRFVELWFAWSICRGTTNSQQTKDDLAKDVQKALLLAKNTDAMDEATAMLPPGAWALSRRGRRQRWDHGNADRLIG